MNQMSVPHSIVDKTRQSPRLDLSQPINSAWIKSKTVVITGGASGFGAGFFKAWAAAGACVIIGDINVKKGDNLVRDVRKQTGNQHLHFCHCDVADWKSQVELFRFAAKESPHGGIDTVVANAGVTDPDNSIERPQGLDAVDPPPPNLKVLDINLTGVVYTTHLALFYLARNPGSVPSNPNSDPSKLQRDRHLILIASMAGLSAAPPQTLYTASKHAVVGLYRNLRSSSFAHGVRTNLICPYFIDTPLMTAPGRALLAGGAMGKTEDVVEAASRFAADPRIAGRAVTVGPRMKVRQETDGQWTLVESQNEPGEDIAIHEVYADDFENTEVFTRNYVNLLNRVVEIRGWLGWARDIIAAIRHGVGL